MILQITLGELLQIIVLLGAVGAILFGGGRFYTLVEKMKEDLDKIKLDMSGVKMKVEHHEIRLNALASNSKENV